MRSAAGAEPGSAALDPSGAPGPPGSRPPGPGPAAGRAGRRTRALTWLAGAGEAGRRTRALTWLAGAGIGSSILVMIATSAVRDSWMTPSMPGPAAGPPWDLRSVHITPGTATVALWLAAIAGAAGVAAGLAAVRRGARPSLRVLLVAAGIAVAALTVLPPAGSTDAFDYASYGRIMALGHNPYVMTPYHLRLMHDSFSPSVPTAWQHVVSVYGPLATVEQFLAARLGGGSAARTVFWLKLWDSVAFALVALVIDRLLRSDPARRLRGHLLWTVNPLLLWNLIAAGHLDVLAAAAGLIGLAVLGEQSGTARPSAARVLAAGALIGIAADIKINYVLFGLGAAWALRRAPAALLAVAGAALAVLGPSYAWFGSPAVEAIVDRRNGASVNNFYRAFILDPRLLAHLAVIAGVLVVTTAWLALRRMPPGDPLRPAVRPALAVSAAWLFIWPYQFPWYDAMLVCLLVLYPASRLDWLVLIRLVAGTIPNTPGHPMAHPPPVAWLHHVAVHAVSPMILLAVAVGFVWLCWSGRWGLGQAGPPVLDRSPAARSQNALRSRRR